MGLEGVKTGAFVLRFFEMICAIVAFATIVDYDSYSSKIRYTMFTGITGFVLALFFMAAYTAGVSAARGLISLVLDSLWVIFWLAAAAAMSNIVAGGGTNSNIKASCAFSWLSWFLWIGSTFVSFKDWRGGSPGPAPSGPPAPAIPNSSVSMV